MIISMRPHATREEIDYVCERIRDFGYKVHSIQGEERVVIGVVGIGDVTACLESLEATPGVERAMRISAPYKFVSKEFKKERTQMRINGLEIGGDDFIVMAGPCSVESERQIMTSVIVPSALAWTFASLTPSISFALIGVVVGEFIGGESGGGLGYLIIQSLGTLNAADMMVALFVLGAIGIVMALGIKQLEARLLRWRPENRQR